MIQSIPSAFICVSYNEIICCCGNRTSHTVDTRSLFVILSCSPGHILTTFCPNTDFDIISLICRRLLSFYGVLKLKFCIHLSCHLVCTVCSVLSPWIEPSKRAAFSFSHDNWYLNSCPFRQRTAQNAARTTNWEKSGEREREREREREGGRERGWGRRERDVLFNGFVSSPDYRAAVADE